MNKEIINKFKKEFEHWLKGGKILYRRRNWVNPNSWQSSDQIWEHPDNSNLDIIINDEYVEFRKALADGKIVEYNPKSSIHDEWIELPINCRLSPTRIDTIKNYRIKPEDSVISVPNVHKSVKPKITNSIFNEFFVAGYHIDITELNRYRVMKDSIYLFDFYSNSIIDESNISKELIDKVETILEDGPGDTYFEKYVYEQVQIIGTILGL